MNKFFYVVFFLFFFLATSSNASYLSVIQQANFTYYSSPYYGFIYDYNLGYMESNTGGFIYRNSTLYFTAQAPTYMTTHVAYIYSVGAGRYTEALAFINQYLY